MMQPCQSWQPQRTAMPGREGELQCMKCFGGEAAAAQANGKPDLKHTLFTIQEKKTPCNFSTRERSTTLPHSPEKDYK